MRAQTVYHTFYTARVKVRARARLRDRIRVRVRVKVRVGVRVRGFGRACLYLSIYLGRS